MMNTAPAEKGHRRSQRGRVNDDLLDQILDGDFDYLLDDNDGTLDDENIGRRQVRPVVSRMQQSPIAQQRVAIGDKARLPDRMILPSKIRSVSQIKPKVEVSGAKSTVSRQVPVPEVKPSPVPEVQSSPVAEVKPSPAAETQPAPVAEAQSSPVAEVKPSPVAEAQSSPVAEAQSSPVPEVQSSPVPEAQSSPVAEVQSSPIPTVEPSQVPAAPGPQERTTQPEVKAEPPKANVSHVEEKHAPVEPRKEKPGVQTRETRSEKLAKAKVLAQQRLESSKAILEEMKEVKVYLSMLVGKLVPKADQQYFFDHQQVVK